jgi:hypothetical protein
MNVKKPRMNFFTIIFTRNAHGFNCQFFLFLLLPTIHPLFSLFFYPLLPLPSSFSLPGKNMSRAHDHEFPDWTTLPFLRSSQCSKRARARRSRCGTPVRSHMLPLVPSYDTNVRLSSLLSSLISLLSNLLFWGTSSSGFLGSLGVGSSCGFSRMNSASVSKCLGTYFCFFN